LCRRLRIPVNVADAPNLCTFTLLSTYSDGPLQVGVTTSGKGCKLASRIRREIASSLPSELGAACTRLGTVRRRIWEEDHKEDLTLEMEEEDDRDQKATFNKLVHEEDLEAAKTRRMRWLSQICEYWPLARLAAITDDDVDAILKSYSSASPSSTSNSDALLSPQSLDSRANKGRIILAGSGPGNPDLLTTATHKAILAADLILADKLVPAPVLALVPRRTEVYIARKFPGNAERAQEELLSMGLAALKQGKVVVRLKQGDPYIYGRGAEEYAFFKKEGYVATVLPGITSALSAPLFAGIPSTHRAVADQVLICTGTGKKGAAPDPPEYRESRTVVFLMALHRLGSLVESLTTDVKEVIPEQRTGADPVEKTVLSEGSSRKLYPRNTPCAVIERASCSDQRVVRTTLEFVCAAIEEEGSRPPGLLVVGWACEVLFKNNQKWVVEDGFKGLDGISGIDGAETLAALGSCPALEVTPLEKDI
jgi:uroporphyrin-III C-methyltransferase